MAWDYFLNLADADSYFTVERLETASWDLLNAVTKEKCVNFSYNRLFYDDQFNLPTMAAATAPQLVILRKAIGEMAYYIALHLEDEDRRKGIQAQGTIEAGIVKEIYHADWLDKLPVPPFVLVLLAPFKANLPGYKCDIDRDENFSVDEDVTGL